MAPPVDLQGLPTLQSGENPDVVVQGALAEAGTARVPGMVGEHQRDVARRARGSLESHGHLAFAQEFYPGTEDAWRVALRAVAEGSTSRPRP